MKYFIFIFLFFNSVYSFSQKEFNIWYFGDKAGVDFNSGTPLVLTNSNMNALEGCASICDSSGSLIFYTNGIEVRDQNHQIMPNGSGLSGHNSSSQSAIIVKKPGNDSIYYIFTTGADASLQGLRYTEIDITLNNGLGDVNGNKNVPVLSSVFEKVTSVRHSNQLDYWIITHKFGTNSFYCYLYTANGLSNVPIISSVGNVINGYHINAIGYLKASLKGDRLAMANFGINTVSVFDFDKTTGIVSNAMIFSTPPISSQYGVEFSPDGSFLYVSAYVVAATVYQYNLDLGSYNAIANSVNIIGQGIGTGAALQLGPDMKIYHSCNFGNHLGVIDNPNAAGTKSYYIAQGVYLNGRISRVGLPYYDKSFSGFFAKYFCFGDSTYFELVNTNVDSVLWNFGDPLTGINNYSKLLNPLHVYSDTGYFYPTLVVYKSGQKDTMLQKIYIQAIGYKNIGNDTTLCEGDTLVLNASYPGAKFLWHDSTLNPVYPVSQPGVYYAETTFGRCSITDSIIITYSRYPKLNIGEDTTLCFGDLFTLNAGNSNCSHLWSNGKTDSTITVNQSNTYWVKVNDNGCEASDTINIEVQLSPDIDLGNDTTLCLGEVLWKHFNDSNLTYLWQDSFINDSFLIDGPKTVWVTTKIKHCIYADTLAVNFRDCTTILEMPNVFTPNGDGYNDLLLPIEYANILYATIYIYNRWGALLYESTNLNEGWDGSYNNSLCSDGVYFWVIDYVATDNTTKSITGSLTLISNN